jgi:hypothetical protein
VLGRPSTEDWAVWDSLGKDIEPRFKGATGPGQEQRRRKLFRAVGIAPVTFLRLGTWCGRGQVGGGPWYTWGCGGWVFNQRVRIKRCWWNGKNWTTPGLGGGGDAVLPWGFADVVIRA